MDVRCERCSTEYEFDDALVSGRGTTVKCTNCGHKFKIRRKDGDFSEDFWNVQTGDGRTLVFTSLRELQRAIQTNLVDRNDLLSRGGLKQKAIGQIPELAPFFEQRDQRKSLPPPAVAGTTSAAPGPGSRPPPPPGPSSPPLAPPPRQRMATRPDFPPMPPPERSELPPDEALSVPAPAPAPAAAPATRMNKTLIGFGGDEPAAPSSLPTQIKPVSAPPSEPTQIKPPTQPPQVKQPVVGATTQPLEPPPVPASPAMRERLGSLRPSETPPSTEREVEPDTQRFDRESEQRISASAMPPVAGGARPSNLSRTDPIYLPKHTPPPPAFEASSPLPAPTNPVLRTMNLDQDDYSDGTRGRGATFSDNPPSMGRRRSVGGFIVAFVVLAGVALIGVVWARTHLGGLLGRPTAPVVTTDPRVATLLATGEKALADGHLDVAKESFDKASALAEKDPHVLLDVARLGAVRADIPWLKSRLLSPDAADEIRSTKDDLAELSAVARRAADDALAVAPEDPAALRAKIDALRISGDRDGARALVARVAPSASQPETAYVLAALDLAENEPLWSTVIDRLRLATSTESGPGRARAGLAYALAKSGDGAGAKAEVERLAAMSRQHPLLPLLRTFADRAKTAAKPDGGVADGGLVASAADAGRVRAGDREPPEPGEKPEKPEKGGKTALSGDARQLVVQGEKARAKGDLDRAQMFFAAALDRNPNDTEALNGLATIAHSRHDLNGARASYKRVLSINPSYVPALVGIGDVDWESGDRASAMKTYKEIVDRFPEGSYPGRVKQRLDSAAAPTPIKTATPVETGPVPSDPGGGG